MQTTQKNNLNTKIEESFLNILFSLGDKEKVVISKRLGLSTSRETLQQIGDSFSPSITRERVRQIENAGIKKIGRIIKSTQLIEIQEKSIEILEMHGGLLIRDKLISAIIKELNLDKNINFGILEVILQSDFSIQKSKPKIMTDTFFFLPTVSKKSIDLIHNIAVKTLKKKKDVMNTAVLYEHIKQSLPTQKGDITNPLIDSILDVFKDIVKGETNLIALTSWRILNPKTLKDKAIYVLKKEKIPMHFIEISNKITNYLGGSVKVNTIHNELIRNEDFVLVGRGLYVLKEWGFKNGTVLDVIIEIMKKTNEAISTDEIIKKVAKVRHVKATTVYMNLQNKKFIERVGRNFYKLK